MLLHIQVDNSGRVSLSYRGFAKHVEDYTVELPKI